MKKLFLTLFLLCIPLMAHAGDSIIEDSGNNARIGSSSTISIEGDLLFPTAGGGVAYGDMYVAENATETTITVQGTFYQITDFNTNGSSNLVTPDHTNDHLTPTKTGIYKATVILCLDGVGGSAAVYSAELFKNNGATAFLNVHCSARASGNANEEITMTLSGIVSLTANDTIEVWIKNITNTENIIVEDIVLSLVQIGG